jgi:hypothetical protein
MITTMKTINEFSARSAKGLGAAETAASTTV